MNAAPRFFSSSIGLKVVMAVTGVALVLFVIVHMLGNLQVFIDPELLTVYGEKLRAVPALLWGARVGLLVMVLLHMWAAYRLTVLNARARPEGYRAKEHRESTLASRTMRVSGVLIVIFVLYHLAHFTWGWRAVHPQFIPGDVAHNFITAFRSPVVSTLYILAMLALFPHLYHGVWSWMQTLGLSHPRYNPLR
ncbi:MAG TPA: succinate dehydrogenase cytochrome b subunit, partial [Vicinamibacteria bacterium]|nr:succinate dehydrogenase cytochrome b subunit [Vicinamibacteria bacterium]